MTRFEKSNIDNLLLERYQSKISKLPEPTREKYLSLQKENATQSGSEIVRSNRQKTFNKDKFYNKDKELLEKPKLDGTMSVENV